MAITIGLVVVASGFQPAFASVSTTPQAATLSTATAHPSREVFGFALASSLADPTVGYPSWNFDLLSTVAFFGVHVDTAGQFVSDSGWSTWNSASLTNLVSLAHQHGVKVVLTVVLQDFSPNTPSMCSGLQHDDATVTQTVNEVKAKGVDGVNIDYEGLDGSCGTSDPYWAQHTFTSFVQKMRSGLGSSYYLSVDTYASSATDGYGFFDVPGIAPSVDSFFVMAYDLEYSNYSRLPTSCSRFCLGPTSPLTAYYYNDTSVASQYTSAAGAAKTILGVPYYGRKSCVTAAVANAYPTSSVVADSYLDASAEATDSAVQAGSYASHRDSYSAGMERWDTWYNTSLGCTRELYWDDATSLGKKYDLVNADGLRGVGLWNLNYGGGAPELWSTLAGHFAKCASTSLTPSAASPQPTGAHITFTAAATGCTNPQYRFWVQNPGGAWTVVQDYGATNTYLWTATGQPGSYGVEVDARASAGVTYDAVANLTYVLQPCASVSLAPSPASPQQPGTAVTLTATASCTGPAQYRFWLRPPGAAWRVVQDYSPNATYNWATTGLAVGAYGLEADVRNAGSSQPYEAVSVASYVLDPPCGAPGLTASPASPQGAGQAVTLTATSTGCPSPRYRFWIRPPGAAWTVAQDYSAQATYAWATAGLQPGSYGLEVDVRDAGSTAAYDAVTNITDSLTVCASAGLSSNPASPQAPGASITLTATATCSGTPQYRFWVRAPGGSWTVVSDYGAAATYTWATSGKASGWYGLEVDVRDVGSTASYETVANLSYLLDVCTSARITANPTSPQPPATPVTLTGSATCAGTPEYRFWVRPPGGAWTMARDYSAAATFSYTPSSGNGVYGFEVDVRDHGSSAAYDTVANLNFLFDTCSSAHLTTDKPSPEKAGTAVVLTGSATCAGTPEYRFWVRAPGGAWRIVQDYSTTATWTWNTTGLAAGTYGLEVDVRDQGSTSAYETVANLSFVLS